MSDDQPASNVSHTVTIEIPPKQWNKQSWEEFKKAVKALASKYEGTITSLTFEAD